MTYGLVAIVKDEADTIGLFLDSAMQVCNVATIVDTGSADGTVERATAHLPIGSVYQREWVNFGRNRTEAFGLARDTADWLLALDADMTVEIDPDFEPNPLVDAYMIRMGDGDFEYRLPLLLRGDLPWESRGAVHEYTCLPDRDYTSLPTDKVRVTMHGGDRSGREKSLWHASLLEAELAEDPENARSIFYLANTYWDLKDPRALLMYEKRAKMGGWAEEVFYAKYRRALCLPTWPAKLLALIETTEFRPTRYEPIYELARELNYRGLHHAAYRFASIPVVPTTDHLFVHRSVERWGMAFELSIAEWWVGDKDRAYAIMDELLAMPDLPATIREATLRNRSLGAAA